MIDPHYVMWGGATYYDFQGECDNIAVDNDILQLQYCTRYIGSDWSGITQIALKWKQTSSMVFSLDATTISDSSPTGIIVNNVNNFFQGVISYREEIPPNSKDGAYMYFTFIETSDDEEQKAFIRVQARVDEVGTYSYDVQIKAHDSIFKGSNGILGSYDNTGIMQLRNGSQIDATSLSDEEIMASVQSWELGPSENLLNGPSSICGYRSPTVPPTKAPTSSSPVVQNPESLSPAVYPTLDPTTSSLANRRRINNEDEEDGKGIISNNS